MIRGKGVFARFAVKGSQIGSLGKHKKLLAPKDLKLSVSCITGLDGVGIKEEGIKVVERRKGADHLHGWAEFTKTKVKEVGLRVCCDNNPPRHAHILGWPEDIVLRKQKQQDLAKKFCTTKQFDPAIPVPQ